MKELITALVKAQQEISAPVKDKVNPRFKSKYCSLDSILEAVRIPLAKNGLSITHSILNSSDHFMESTLYHISGESLSVRIPLAIDRLDMQGIGSARTYAIKYNTTALLGLPSDDDDDGNEAVAQAYKPVPLNKQQLDEIEQLADGDDTILERILAKYTKKPSLSDIDGVHFEVIKAGIKKLKDKKNEV